MVRSTPRLETIAPWLALFVAFSPVLVNLAGHLAAYPDDRLTLLGPLLLLLAISRSREGHTPGHWDGAAGITVGVALQMLGLLSGSWSIARLGFPVAAVGLARWRGEPRLVVTALLFFAIPVPDTLVGLGSPALEIGLARSISLVLDPLGAPVQVAGLTLVAPAGRIPLYPPDGGMSLAFAFAGLGWYSAASEGAGLRRAALRATLFALPAFPLQWLVVLTASALLGAGLHHAAELWLRKDAWPLMLVLAVVWVHRRWLISPRPIWRCDGER